MVASGDLNDRVRFERRTSNAGGEGGDTFGRASGGWEPMFGAVDQTLEERNESSERWARFESKVGRETTAGRVEGVQPFEVVVRRDPETVKVSNVDRVVLLSSPQIFLNITAAAPHPTEPREFILLTCVGGGANG